MAELQRQLVGYRISMALHVVAALGIPDLLANGSRTAEDLANATDTHASSLYRLLRALAAEDVFEELPDRRFALTAKSELLRSDNAASLRDYALFIVGARFVQGWGELQFSLRTGKSGVEKSLGMDMWEWQSKNPEESQIFDRAMTSITRMGSAAVVAGYDWGQFRVIADIAGGHGAQLADILVAFPTLRGILFEQPHVATGAVETMRAAGVADRCDTVSGSFFESVPTADAYMLKHILHDWYDEDAARILQTIQRAAPLHARLLVIEQLIGPPNEGAEAKSADLNKLVGPGGMERTSEEFEALFSTGGWRVVALHPAGSRYVIEGVLA